MKKLPNLQISINKISWLVIGHQKLQIRLASAGRFADTAHS
jgi:hypothetical protein